MTDITEWDEKTFQKFDEWSGAAGYDNLASSYFYKDPHNAKRYREELEKARHGRKSLDLSTVKDWATVKGVEYRGPKNVIMKRTVSKRLNPDDYKGQ